MRNLCVLGLDEENRRLLDHVLAPDERLVEVLDHDEIRGVDRFPFDQLVEATRQRLDAHCKPIHGVTTLLDFPATELVPVLAAATGTPGPTLEAVLRCNHKYWSRLVQRDAAPTNVPAFAALDPWDERAFETLSFDPPLWIKPINAYRSHLGFHIRDREDFVAAQQVLREELPKLAGPLQEVLDRAHLPPEIAELPYGACLAEGLIGGRQCTVEGYVHRGEVVCYGVVDSVRSPHRSSFARYQDPSSLPRRITRQMAEIAQRIMGEVGYDDAPFNLEFFVDRTTNQIWVLEINPRLSQSHCELFERVDGQSHHRVMLDVAQGRAPAPPHRQGRDKVAAKFFVRAWKDATVTRLPDAERVADIEDLHDATINIHVKEGARLSELEDQEAYSYELATIFLGSDTVRDLRQRYREIEALLDIGLEA